jgi:PHP family Zn ribbon phosphoesterase
MIRHSEEQYQLSMHIAALSEILMYASSDMPDDAKKQLEQLRAEMAKKIKEIDLAISPEELFNYICNIYLPKH